MDIRGLENSRYCEDNVRTFLDGWGAQTEAGKDEIVERILGHADPRLGQVISHVLVSGGPRGYKPSNAASHFDALARSIIYQQLSKQAAASIYSRYAGAFGGPPSPEQVLAGKVGFLKQAGLSTQKVRYLQALASAILSGELNLTRVDDLPDEAVVEQLTRVPGIGIWTAQMFLMFRLRRPDVLPIADVGVRRGLQLAYGMRRPAAPNYVKRVGRRWAPYRSIACLYLWAAVDIGFVGAP